MEPHLPARAIEKVDSFLSAVVADEVENDALMGNRIVPGPAEVRSKITHLLGTIEALSETVIKQEAQLYELQTGRKALQKAFGVHVSPAEIAARTNTLSGESHRFGGAGRSGGCVPQRVVASPRHDRSGRGRERSATTARGGAAFTGGNCFKHGAKASAFRHRFGDDTTPEDALGRLRDAERAADSLREENDTLQMRLAAQAERTEVIHRERDRLLGLLDAPDVDTAEAALRTLHENAAAYNDIASLLGDVGKELGKIGG